MQVTRNNGMEKVELGSSPSRLGASWTSKKATKTLHQTVGKLEMRPVARMALNLVMRNVI